MDQVFPITTTTFLIDIAIKTISNSKQKFRKKENKYLTTYFMKNNLTVEIFINHFVFVKKWKSFVGWMYIEIVQWINILVGISNFGDENFIRFILRLTIKYFFVSGENRVEWYNGAEIWKTFPDLLGF